MSISPEVSRAIQQAREEFSRGRKGQAYWWAAKAARLAPELEEPWLLLASAASPDASAAYLWRALEINPGSQQAREGLAWAEKREQVWRAGIGQREESETEITGPIRVGGQVLVETPLGVAQRKKRRESFLVSTLPYFAALFVVCIALLGVTILGLASVVDFPQANPAQKAQPLLPVVSETIAAAVVPSDTPTLQSTSTPEPTETQTPSPEPSATPLPPTETRIPVVMPTFITLPPPQPRQQPANTGYSQGEEVSRGEGRWIEVNLSQQMVYAHEGNKVVASFLVSTGTASHPTVTGDFNIWIKLLADDMQGPGYYLRDVPYVMYFYKGYGLHGTYWHHNFGTPMSHGCVNLATPDAKWLFNWASVGTLVHVHY